jgi:hypothetical protein
MGVVQALGLRVFLRRAEPRMHCVLIGHSGLCNLAVSKAAIGSALAFKYIALRNMHAAVGTQNHVHGRWLGSVFAACIYFLPAARCAPLPCH